jgi:hypothetical protein
MRRHTRPFLAFFAGTLFFVAGSAWAQFTQYTSPGGPQDRPESRKERLEREVENARYHLGAVRVAPWFGIRDASFVRSFSSDQEDSPSDFTATVGAGLRTYLRTGPKVIWTAEALPEYVWWNNDPGRSRVNGRYGFGGHAFWNRLVVEATAGRQQEQQILTPEIPDPSSARTDEGRLIAELWATGAISVFADTRLAKVRYLDRDTGIPELDQLELLDRQETVTRAGLRWRPREAWIIGVGAESSRAEFDRDPLDRSNEGTAPTLEVSFNRPKLYVQLDLAARSLEARQGARFVDFDGVTGNASVSLRPRRRTDFWVYANRNLVYTLNPVYAYMEDERVGTALSSRLGSRTVGRIYVETGTESYTVFDPATPQRQDDLLSFGGAATFRIRRAMTLSVLAVRTRFSSDSPGNDRSYTYVGTRLNLFGDR